MFAGVFDLYVSFRVLILFLHVLAVLTWVGGLVYQVVVVAPLAKKGAANAAALRVGLACEARFRAVMWPAVGIALFTGLGERDERLEQPASGWCQPAGCFRFAVGHQASAGRGDDPVADRPAVRGVSQASGSGGSGGAGPRRAAGRIGGLATPGMVAARCHRLPGRCGHSVCPFAARIGPLTSASGLREPLGLHTMALFFQAFTTPAKRALHGVTRGIGSTCQRVQGGKEKQESCEC